MSRFLAILGDMAGARRALFGIVAMMSMLLSALGIAYMASVSYPDELGIVDARVRETHERALQVARSTQEHVQSYLTKSALGDSEALDGSFVVSPSGLLIVPSLEPLRQQEASDLDALMPTGGFQGRHRKLLQARQQEWGGCAPKANEDGCVAKSGLLASAQKNYEELSTSSDTAAEALLGLARLHRRAGSDGLAASRYRELALRFARSVNDAGVPYLLLAEIGVSQVSRTPAATFHLLRKLMARRYNAPNALLEVTAETAFEGIVVQKIDSAQRGEFDILKRAFEGTKASASFAKRLAPRLAEVQQTALNSEVKSLRAPWDAHMNLVYQKFSDGRIHGVVVSEMQIQRMAQQAARELGLQTSFAVTVQTTELQPSAERQRWARASLGPLWTHLAVVILDRGHQGDAMQEIAAARRRHRGITGGLVIVLVLGLVATIRGAAQQRELARLKSDFVTTVSHELKTPLTSIRMFAEMLQQGVAGQDQKRISRYQTIIVKESERLGLLIANLLDYSQIERGTRRYDAKTETAAHIAEEAEETFARLREGEGQGLRLRIEAEATSLCVKVDRSVLVQCLLNLLSNAAKYGGDADIELAVEPGRTPGRVAWIVKDQGPGIPKSERERVFREFYRAPQAVSSAIEGTGLGLALVKRHVEALGGTISLSGEPGEGAIFRIELETEMQ